MVHNPHNKVQLQWGSKTKQDVYGRVHRWANDDGEGEEAEGGQHGGEDERRPPRHLALVDPPALRDPRKPDAEEHPRRADEHQGDPHPVDAEADAIDARLQQEFPSDYSQVRSRIITASQNQLLDALHAYAEAA